MIVSNTHKFIYFFSIGNTATRSLQLSLCHYHDNDLFTILDTDDWCKDNEKIFDKFYKP